MKRNCCVLFAAIALASCNSKESSTAPDRAKPSQGSEADSRPAEIPAWVPLYPGGKIGKVELHKTPPIETYQQFVLSDIPADCVKVTQWYDEKLKLAGFDVVKSAGWTNGYCMLNLNADGPGNVNGVRMSGDGRETTSLTINAISRDMPGAAPQSSGKAPAWLPQYPGAKPANFVATDSGPEHRLEFNFTTGDEAPKIIAWYEQQLRGAGFDIASSGASDSQYGRLSASKSSSIVSVRVEPVGSNRGVFIETRDGVQ